MIDMMFHSYIQFFEQPNGKAWPQHSYKTISRYTIVGMDKIIESCKADRCPLVKIKGLLYFSLHTTSIILCCSSGKHECMKTKK